MFESSSPTPSMQGQFACAAMTFAWERARALPCDDDPLRRAVRPRHHLPRCRPLRPRRREHVCAGRRRRARCAVRRGHLPPPRRSLRAAGDPVHRLPAARRLPALPGPADGRSARPASGRRRRRRDVLRRHRGRPAGARGRRREGGPSRSDPPRSRRRPLHRLPRREGGGQRARSRPGLDDPLRRARRHRRRRVRLALWGTASRCDGCWSRGRCAATGSSRSGCAATGRRRRRSTGWPWRASAPTRWSRSAGVDSTPVSRRPRGSPRTTATASSSRSTSTSATPGTRPEPAPLEPGGLTARQLLDSVRRLGLELPIVGMDIVEVSPPYDQADITAALANRVVLEALSAIARRRRDAAGGAAYDPDRPLLER